MIRAAVPVAAGLALLLGLGAGPALSAKAPLPTILLYPATAGDVAALVDLRTRLRLDGRVEVLTYDPESAAIQRASAEDAHPEWLVNAPTTDEGRMVLARALGAAFYAVVSPGRATDMTHVELVETAPAGRTFDWTGTNRQFGVRAMESQVADSVAHPANYNNVAASPDLTGSPSVVAAAPSVVAAAPSVVAAAPSVVAAAPSVVAAAPSVVAAAPSVVAAAPSVVAAAPSVVAAAPSVVAAAPSVVAAAPSVVAAAPSVVAAAPTSSSPIIIALPKSVPPVASRPVISAVPLAVERPAPAPLNLPVQVAKSLPKPPFPAPSPAAPSLPEISPPLPAVATPKTQAILPPIMTAVPMPRVPFGVPVSQINTTLPTPHIQTLPLPAPALPKVAAVPPPKPSPTVVTVPKPPVQVAMLPKPALPEPPSELPVPSPPESTVPAPRSLPPITVKKSAPTAEDVSAIQPLLERGDSALDGGDAVSAIALYRQAVNGAPLSIVPRLKLAQAYQKDGLNDRALDEARRALEIAPDNTPVQQFLSDLDQQTGTTAGSLIRARAVLERSPSDPAAHAALADTLWNNGDLGGAEAEFKAVQALSAPGSHLADAQLAQLYAAEARYDDCLASLRSAGSGGYALAIQIVKNRSETLSSTLSASRDVFAAHKSTREQFYDDAKKLSAEAQALAGFVTAVKPPAQYRLSHLHRMLSTNLLAQETATLVTYIETSDSRQNDSISLLERAAATEMLTAQATEERLGLWKQQSTEK